MIKATYSTRYLRFGMPLLAALASIVILISGCSHPARVSRVRAETPPPAPIPVRVDSTSSTPSDSYSSDTASAPSRARNIVSEYMGEEYASRISDDSTYEDIDPEELWQSFDMAEEYYTMGVTANREGSWEEAQYFFEKALKVMANLEVDSDSLLTPEAVKYNTLLDNVVADYRVSLRSLGRLDEDAAPSAIVERFNDIEDQLGLDSMLVRRGEGGPVSYDLPISMNDRVRKSIVYFQTVANKAFRKYLSRVKRYEWLYTNVLTEKELPQDLIYLSLVESGYNPHAYSWARAMGLWQFIASTGQIYGLDRTWWVDERKDPVKATNAAASFLKDLYEKFGDWELAMAAYNGGPGRVDRTIKSQGTRDFWKLRLRKQTMDYVPLIYAAAIISKEPEKYGFGDVEYEPPILWDEVTIDRSIELKQVAHRMGCSLDQIQELNPELLRSITPPNTNNYVLKVPVGMREKFWQVYDEIPSAKETYMVKHKVKKRETLGSIATKYGVSQHALAEANNLATSARVKTGRTLLIPVSGDRSPAKAKSSTASKAVNKPVEVNSLGKYVVQPGDTPWDIAQAFNISVEELRRVNKLTSGSRIYVGQTLSLPDYVAKTKSGSAVRADEKPQAAPSKGKKTTAKDAATVNANEPVKVHVVRSGETVSEIAEKYKTSADQVRKLNGLGRNSRIFVGQELIVVAPIKSKGKSSTDYVVHKVRNGDTLTGIAQKYRTTIEKILATNGINDPDNLKIGSRLKIFTN